MGALPVLLALACLTQSRLLPDSVDGKSAPVDRFTYRVLGLFSPDREKDLCRVFVDLPDFRLIAVDFDDAEITIEFTPAKALPGQKPEKFVELVDQKLRSASRGTFGVAPRRNVPRDKLKLIVIPVSGLDCKACCLAAYEAIARIDGVVQATASFKDGRVTALIDPKKTDRAKLEEALRKKGVDVRGP